MCGVEIEFSDILVLPVCRKTGKPPAMSGQARGSASARIISELGECTFATAGWAGGTIVMGVKLRSLSLASKHWLWERVRQLVHKGFVPHPWHDCRNLSANGFLHSMQRDQRTTAAW